jgi:hypothetical protein
MTYDVLRRVSASLLAALLACASAIVDARESPAPPSPVEIGAIAASLPDLPAGLVPKCDDRAAWGDAALRNRMTRILRASVRTRTEPVAPWSDDAYLSYSKSGDRNRGEAMMKARQSPLIPLVLAECVEYDQRSIERITAAVQGLLDQPTWILPAHDRQLIAYRNGSFFVDLNAAEVADTLALTIYLLDAKLPDELKKKVRAALEARVFAPFRASISGKHLPGHKWLMDHTNWNAVCLEGITSAALTVIPDKIDRARFVWAAKVYIQNYLDGFPDDGYATEGIGYWNYGFGHFLELREKLVRATSGQLDLFMAPKARQVAMFGARFSMFSSNAALFGDAPPSSRPDHDTLVYVDRAFGSSLSGFTQFSEAARLLTLFPDRVTPVPVRGQPSTEDPRRQYFPSSGVLVARPASGTQMKLATTIKAGGNTTHSHNDIGSYVIGMGAEQPAGDPGGVKYYDRNSFSPERYQSKVFNSYGHPVPVIDGQLQSNATTIQLPPPVTRFTDEIDEYQLDMRSAYASSRLEKLARVLRYSRGGKGSVEVTDRFLFKMPSSFETAITTRGTVIRLEADEVELSSGSERVIAKVSASEPFELLRESIQENGLEFIRIGIRLRSKLREGHVSIRYTPSPP